MTEQPQLKPWHQLLTDRELKELTFAIHYALHFNHGTAGHNRLLLIAKLADIIDSQHKPDTETVA